MRLKSAVIFVVVLGVTAPSSGAAERQIASGSVQNLSAAGGWVEWGSSTGYNKPYLRTYLFRGDKTVVEDPYNVTLATNRQGRGVALSLRNEPTTAGQPRPVSLYERLLPNGENVRRFTGPELAHASFDEHRGDFIWGIQGDGIFLQPAGTSPMRRISDIKPGGVYLTGRVMAALSHVDGNTVLTAATRAHPRRWQRIAIADTLDGSDSWTKKGFRQIVYATTDGPYVYWVAESYTFGDPSSDAYRIRRVDLTAAQRTVEAFAVPRTITDFAVTRGRILYSGTGGQDLFEYRRAPFAPTGERLPVIHG